MRKLDRKLLRDCLHMRGQLAAIALIVASAIAMYVTMYGAYESLEAAQARCYAEDRFAHVFAQLKRAPRSMLDDIRAIPGVAVAEGRVVLDVALDVPGRDEPATGRIVSLGGTLNHVRLRRGHEPDPTRADEVLASEQFCAANHLDTGATLQAVINQKKQRLTITGIGTSPEYINEVSGAASFPDHERFGVLWMPELAAESALSMRGAFNDLVVTLARGAKEKDVISAIDARLARYGGIGAYGRADQQSHAILRSEMTQDRVTAAVTSGIFLFVAAFLINMVLSRVVIGQRDQIAILKAFGYSTGTIALHYLGFALIVVAAGAIIGIPLGIFFGSRLTGLYADFFAFRAIPFSIDPASVMLSVAVSAIAASGGALGASFRAAMVPPAEGMRGEQPPSFHATRLEGLHRALSSAVRMIARSMERRPLRTVLASIGIALAVMVLMLGRFSFRTFDAMVDLHFRAASRDDVTVMFIEPRKAAVTYELARLPGVVKVEPFRAVPVRIHGGHVSRRVALLGMDRDASLRRLVALDRTMVPIPDKGVVLTRKLASILGVTPGGQVRIETLTGKRQTFDIEVSATVDEIIGLGAYIERNERARLLGEGDAVSGAWLSADRSRISELNRTLKSLPAISAVTYREAMVGSFMQMAAKSLSIQMTSVIFFACLISFAVIYNSARIALSERGRDLATLRVLGFSRREVGALLLGEQAVITLLGVPLGFILGRTASLWLVRLLDTEQFRLLPLISADTYGFAFLMVLAASVVSAAAVWRRVASLDLVEVLKTRE